MSYQDRRSLERSVPRILNSLGSLNIKVVTTLVAPCPCNSKYGTGATRIYIIWKLIKNAESHTPKEAQELVAGVLMGI